MQIPETHARERERVQALESYDILDTDAEAAFDDITRLASAICGRPIALVSLVDETRQWFKARVGLEPRETPREQAFCAHAIHEERPFVVPDAAADERFADNPLVRGYPNIRYYAGVPLISPGGLPLGTLCVIDRQPGEPSEGELEALRILANQVMAQLELRRKVTETQRAHRELRAISDFTLSLSKNPDLDSVLDSVFTHLAATHPVDTLVVYRLDQDRNELVYESGRYPESLSPEKIAAFTRNRKLPLTRQEGGLHWLVCEKKRPLYLKRFRLARASASELHDIETLGIQSLLCVPLVVQNEVVGTIDLTRANESMLLTRQDVRSITYFCSQLAGFVRISTLLTRVDADRRRAVRLNELSRRLSALTDLKATFSGIHEFIRETYDSDGTWILRKVPGREELETMEFLFPPEFDQDAEFFRKLRVPLRPETGAMYITCKRQRALYVDVEAIQSREKMSDIDSEISRRLRLRSFLQVPLIVQNRLVGLIAFTNYRDKMILNREDIAMVSTFCGQIAGAIRGADLLNEREAARRVAEEAHAEVVQLNEFVKEIGTDSSVDRISQMIFDYALDHFQMDACLMYLVDDSGEELVHYRSSFPSQVSQEAIDRVVTDSSIPRGPNEINWKVIERKRPLYFPYIKETGGSAGDRLRLSELGARSLLFVPLLVQGNGVGVMIFTNLERGLDLSRGQIERIGAFCSLIAGAVQTSALLDRLEAARRSTELELHLAREIQQGLLALAPFESSGASVAAEYIALEAVGGDFIDYGSGPNGEIGILIGDAAGHGVPAALVASMAKITAESLDGRMQDVTGFLEELNRSLYGKTSYNFVAACYALYVPDTQKLIYAMAGCPPPYLLRPGEPALRLEGRGKPLGVHDSPGYHALVVDLLPGDRVIFLTDGILEARNPQGLDLREEQLRMLLSGAASHAPEALVRTLVADIRGFVGRRGFEDDVTIVALGIDALPAQ